MNLLVIFVIFGVLILLLTIIILADNAKVSYASKIIVDTRIIIKCNKVRKNYTKQEVLDRVFHIRNVSNAIVFRTFRSKQIDSTINSMLRDIEKLDSGWKKEEK